MHPQADLVVEDDRWPEALALWAEDALAGVLVALSMQGDFEVAILACDDARIAELNTEFRGKPVPTNVLSWPAEDRAADAPGGMPDLPDPADPMQGELGDIAIAYDTCAREAAEQGKEFETHMRHLLVHGCLHLLGFDHIRDEDAALMERLEVEILASQGVANPYEV